MIRAIIFSATVATLICLWQDRPAPVQHVQVDYCWQDVYAAAKLGNGEWMKLWTKGYAPCSQLDRYEYI